MNLDPDLHNTLDDVDQDPPPDLDAHAQPLSTPVSDVLMPFTISKSISAQKTDDLCQTVFATIDQSK